MRIGQKSSISLAIAGSALFALVVGAAGCAGERDPVSRVQPNVLAKSFFVGADLKSTTDDPEFYARGTMIDVGTYGSSEGGMFIASYGQPTSRIRWDITETTLFARLSFERIAGSDGKGKGKSTTGKQDGQIIAAYRIQSHFDVRRDFNTSTGEENNVIMEDDKSRPWFDRQSMRIDFSKNMVTSAYDFDTLSQAGLYSDGVQYESVAYEISDPGSLDAPQYLPNEGYLDITNKVLAKPQMVELNRWGIGMYPACKLPALLGGTEPAGNCNPAELTIRQSFRRVDKDDYEPMDWDGVRFQSYGAFTEERRGFDSSYGITDEKLHYFISRYDIWERSHYYKDASAMTGEVACNVPAVKDGRTVIDGVNPNADSDKDGTADSCAAITQATGFGGSQCDMFRKKCTLPYRARTAKPVVWYANVQSAEKYYAQSAEAAHEWDVALRSSIQVARNAECHATDKGDCDSKFPAYSGQMDAHEDATALTSEVDLCRKSGKAEADCSSIADRLGSERGYASEIIALAKMPEAVVFCHSPVEAMDPAACGDKVYPDSSERRRLPAGLTAAKCRDLLYTPGLQGDEAAQRAQCEGATLVRSGDLRYHQILNIEAPEAATFWGIMTDAADPIDGKKVAAAINVYTPVSTVFARGVVDKIRYGNGELTTADVVDGKQVTQHSAFANEVAAMTQEPNLANIKSAYARITPQEVRERVGQAAGVIAITPELEAKAKLTTQNARNSVRDLEFDTRGQSRALAGYMARLAALSGTGDKLSPIEAELVTPAMQQYAQGASKQPLPSMALASITRSINPTVIREMRRMRDDSYAANGLCVMEASDMASTMDPTSNASLGAALARKFGAFNKGDSVAAQNERADRMVDYLGRRAHYAVIAHEMGHSIGLRHNFVSSADPINYRPQYWQLRTHDGRVTQTCTGLQADGSACVGPRYHDAIDTDEEQGLIHMWMQSSIMDYAGELSQDTVGLGAYDFAAARMFYGNAVGVYKDPSYSKDQPRGATALDHVDDFGGIFGVGYQFNGNSIHYSELQTDLKLIDNCAEVDPMSFKPSNWNEAKDGAFDAVLDAHIVKVDGKYTRCKTQPMAFRRWDSLANDPSKKARGSEHNVDAETGAVRVPYGFASDNRADIGNSSVFRHDNGGDLYELFSFFLSAQEVGHVFNDYRRGRQTFDVGAAAKRNLERYNEKMRDAAKGLALVIQTNRNIPLSQLFADASIQGAVLASGMAFDAFTMQMQRPESGGHKRTDGIYRSTNSDGLTPFMVPDGSYGSFGSLSIGGRLVENRLLNDKGDYDVSYRANSGSYYEKTSVGMLLTESADNFVSTSRSDYTDGRPRNVSMADIYPEGFRRFMANAMTGDDFIKGVRVESNASGVPVVDGRFPVKGLGYTSWWRATPTPCFAGQGSLICASAGSQTGLNPQSVNTMAVVDPEIGYEHQKFLWATTAIYLLENERRNWFNQMALYAVGNAASDPGFTNRIELHDPMGPVYVAQSMGTEVIFGKTVQAGIAARMVEYANELLLGACGNATLDTVTGTGGAKWYTAKVSATGTPTCDMTSEDFNIYQDYVGLLNFANRSLQMLDPVRLEKKY